MKLQMSSVGAAMLAAVFFATPGGAASCLDDAIPADQLKSVVDSGKSMPVGIWIGDWDSGHLLGHMAKILVRDVLGFKANISGVGAATESGLFATSGCKNPTDPDNRQCVEEPSVHHITVEVWEGVVTDMWRLEMENNGAADRMSERLGEFNFKGLEGQAIFEDSYKPAYDQEGLDLEYYRAYDTEWHQPWKYFDKPGNVNTSKLKRCNQTLMVNDKLAKDLLQHTGDADGVVQQPDGTHVTKCWNDHWWISPACRNDLTQCIPAITAANGWGLEFMMQRAVAFKAPVAVAVGLEYDDWITLSRAHKGLPYFWSPDTTFVDFRPSKMMVPPMNAEEHAQGKWVTDKAGTPLSKWTSANMQTLAGRVHGFVKKFDMTEKVLMEILFDLKNSGDSYDDVACRWLKANRARWEQWIPQETDCAVGQGLANSNGDFVAELADATSCRWCSPGWYSEPLDDTAICVRCPKGAFQSSPGQTECSLCATGSFTDATTSKECDRCSIGTYQDTDGQSSCKSCPGEKTTLFQAARGESDCVCKAGTYGTDDAECAVCPEGLDCSEANTTAAAIPGVGEETLHPFPKARPGYMTLASAPLEPYKCTPDPFCPGGGPGSCSTNRDPSSIACGKCLDDYYAGQDGKCHRCSNDGVGLMVGFMAFLLVVLLTVSSVVDPRKARLTQANSTIMCAIIVGLTVTSVQSMGVLSKTSVEWVEPLATIFEAMSLLTFDTKAMKLDCTTGGDPITPYVMRQLLAPVSILLVSVFLWLRVTFWAPGLQFLQVFVNLAGTLMQAFFISIVLSCCLPFLCYSHPGDRGSSMIDMPSVLCFEDDVHFGYVAVAIASFVFVVVPYWALVAYGVWNYPKYVADRSDEGNFLICFRFLFVKFTAKGYYYGLAVMTRSLCICLVPVLIRDDSASQLVVLAVVIQTFALWQLLTMPWLSWMCNFMDGVLASLLTLTLMCGALDEGSDTVGILATIVFATIVTCVVVSMGFAARRAVNPTPFFHKFICHHKQDSSAQARYLQLLITQQSGQSVGLDSDYIRNINDLLDKVRTCAGHLLVLLTANTLRSPVCTGEITVAFTTHQRLALLVTPSFVRPTAEEIKDPCTYLDTSFVSLNELGVGMDFVSAAFTWLLDESRTAFHLDEQLLGGDKFEKLVKAVLDQREVNQLPIRRLSSKLALLETQVKEKNTMGSKAGAKGNLVISYDIGDDEACACAGILVAKAQMKLQSDESSIAIRVLRHTPEMELFELNSMVSEATAVGVLLSRGSLECKQQIQVIISAMLSMREVIPVKTRTFTSPTSKFYDSHLPLLVPDSVKAVSAVTSFFEIPVVPFDSHSFESILEAQASDFLSLTIRAFDEPKTNQFGEEASMPNLKVVTI